MNIDITPEELNIIQNAVHDYFCEIEESCAECLESEIQSYQQVLEKLDMSCDFNFLEEAELDDDWDCEEFVDEKDYDD